MANKQKMTTVGRKPPVPLREALDIAELCGTDPCDVNLALGSFWLGSRTSFESRLVKVFKSCVPAQHFEPHISQLCRFYAGLVVERTHGDKFDWVVRVLSSSESESDTSRPQSVLADMLCSAIGARNATDLFFKSAARPPMRVVDRLGGAEALKSRLRYVAQELFMRPAKLSGSVLLIDDICNTGASTRVYASALKQLAGASRVDAVNLAATRFARGKDGRGMLQLDVSGLADQPALGQVWTDGASVLHLRQDCPSAQKPIACEVRFMAERNASLCPACAPAPVATRKWWQIW